MTGHVAPRINDPSEEWITQTVNALINNGIIHFDDFIYPETNNGCQILL